MTRLPRALRWRLADPRGIGRATAYGNVALRVLGAVLLVLMWSHSLFGLGGTGADSLFSRWIYDAVFVVAAVACLLTAFSRPDLRLIAGALGCGLLLSTIGSAIYSLAPDLNAVPVPSVSDPLWLAIYPCEYAAIVLLTRRSAANALLSTRLDGLQSGLAAASVMACVTVPAALRGVVGSSFWEAGTALAYPVADLILLGAVVSAIGLTGWRIDRLWAVLGVAITVWEVADITYLFDLPGFGNTADSLVATGAFGLAVAVGLPAGRRRSTAHSDRGLFVPVAFGAVALAVLLVGSALHLTGVALVLAAASLLLALLRMTLALRENRGLLGTSQVEATTDPLTGLRNRRRLRADLADALCDGSASEPHALVLLDLNGFKVYNDAYGHGAGDDLLQRLGGALEEEVSIGPAGRGTAYRMGGDEFCVLAPLPTDVALFAARCASALASHGDGFTVTAAYGVVLLPAENPDPLGALNLADARMYRNKNTGRPPAARQSTDVLIALLAEQAPDLSDRMRAVCVTACAAAAELGLTGEDLEALRHAAALHDIGKMGIPSAILDKPGPLSDAEWQLVRRHPLIGERILAAAPALARSARIVRSSHERLDGGGYPDGLAGEQIPLASRILSVADAFHAMISARAHVHTFTVSQAYGELRRCAGTQFDAAVVDALARAIGCDDTGTPPPDPTRDDPLFLIARAPHENAILNP